MVKKANHSKKELRGLRIQQIVIVVVGLIIIITMVISLIAR